jgi:hypothetical protein
MTKTQFRDAIKASQNSQTLDQLKNFKKEVDKKFDMYKDMDGKLSVDELMGWDMKF